MTKKIDQTYFDKRGRTEKENRAMYYVLGAILKCGSIIDEKYTKKDGRIPQKFMVKSRHEKLVDIIKEELGSDHTVTHDVREHKSGNLRSSHWFTATAHDLCDRLIEMVGTKHKIEKTITSVPKEYQLDLFRGIYDSVGLMGFNHPEYGSINIQINQSPDVLNLLKTMLKSHSIDSYLLQSRLHLKHDEAIKFRNLIYSKEELYLKDKKGELYLKDKKDELYQEKVNPLGGGQGQQVALDKKIEQIKSLVEAGMKPGEIADLLKYNHKNTLCAFFKTRTEMTLTKYKRSLK